MVLTSINIIEYIVSFLNAVYFLIGLLVVSYNSKAFSPDSYSENCSNVMLLSWLSIGNCFINMYPIMIINIIGFICSAILLGFNGQNLYLLNHKKNHINCREYYEYNVLWNVYIGFVILQMFTLISYIIKFFIELENRKQKNYTIIKS